MHTFKYLLLPHSQNKIRFFSISPVSYVKKYNVQLGCYFKVVILELLIVSTFYYSKNTKYFKIIVPPTRKRHLHVVTTSSLRCIFKINKPQYKPFEDIRKVKTQCYYTL